MTRQHPKVPRPTAGHYQSWINSWTLSLRAVGRSARTVAMYPDAVGLFGGWLCAYEPKVADWDQVGRDQLRRFFIWLMADGAPCPHRLTPGDPPAACSGYGRGYVNNVARCIQQFFAWYAEEEQLPNPCLGFKLPAAPRPGEKLVPVLTPEQLGALIRDAERGRDYESRRDAAILRLFASTGCRLAELAHLQVDDINQERREATVTGKGRKQRTVKYDNKAVVALERYLRLRAKHKSASLPALWIGLRRRTAMTPNGIYQLIARRGEQLGIPLHPHMFRHTFAHRWLDAGGAEGDLMELAGWESPQMLRHYGASARSARARRAYDRIDVMGGV